MWAWTLVLLNIGLWLWAWPGPIEGTIEETMQRISAIERELPEREKLAAWCKKAREAVQNPPGIEPNAFLQRIRIVGEAAGFKLGESTLRPGNPAGVRVSGAGSWRAIQAILNDAGREAAVIVDRLGLTLRDDSLIELRFEARVRNGPWEGDSGRVGIEPSSETGMIPMLSGIDPFAIPAAPPQVTITRPMVRYLGYFSEGGPATVIIETQGKSHLLLVGESPTNGIRIASASPEFLGLVDERGGSWTVPMEKRVGQR